MVVASLVGYFIAILYPLLCNCMHKSQKQLLNCWLENGLVVMAWKEFGIWYGGVVALILEMIIYSFGRAA